MKEWFSASEIAAKRLPCVPMSERGVQLLADRENWKNRPREGRGGGFEYHYSAIPAVARAKLALDASPTVAERPEAGREEMWAWFGRLSPKKRKKAAEKLSALEAVEALIRSGTGKLQAMMLAAKEAGVQVSSLYSWERATDGFARADWLPALAPRQAGAGREADCSPDAWAFIRADYLRPEEASFQACYRRLLATAAAQGWTVPSGRTLERRLLALPVGVRVLAREGAEALKRMYPAQVRDRGVFHALEAVNADGHRWDVFVKWPNGEIGRPMMCAFQDLYSGKILAWRISETAHKGAVRLAFGDLVEEWGIPDFCWLDNGRDFASKWLTGGTPNRYRFKLKDDEPAGIMTQLGVGVHWTTPYAGQSKPIERAFRDFAGDLAKHPRFAGAYVGNSPMAKPENYGNAAVPLDVFVQTVAEGIAEHNARVGRRTPVAAGRSFDATFTESYERSPIRRATAEQRRLWLLAAEGVGVASVDGSVRLMGNRYWAPFLLDFRGQKVAVRFDPEALQEDLQVYRLDGGYLGAAACTEAAGFADADAAREHAKARKAWLRSQKDMLAAEKKLSIRDVAAMLPKGEPMPAPERRVVRLATAGGRTVVPNSSVAVAVADDEQPDAEKHWLAGVRKLRLAANHGLTLGGGSDDE